jgi:hypothetical protein
MLEIGPMILCLQISLKYSVHVYLKKNKRMSIVPLQLSSRRDGDGVQRSCAVPIDRESDQLFWGGKWVKSSTLCSFYTRSPPVTRVLDCRLPQFALHRICPHISNRTSIRPACVSLNLCYYLTYAAVKAKNSRHIPHKCIVVALSFWIGSYKNVTRSVIKNLLGGHTQTDCCYSEPGSREGIRRPEKPQKFTTSFYAAVHTCESVS